jgi:thiol-disulfide isomerase/thioredoxin
MTNKARIRVAAALAGVTALIVFAAGRKSDGASASPGGRQAVPELRLPGLDGKIWKLSEHRGRVVLVNFWATWCPPCRYETPGLVAFYRKYEPRGLSAVGISMDEEGPEVVRQFVKKYQIPYPVLLPGESGVGSQVQGLPTTLLIDKRGRLAKTYEGLLDEAELRHDVERLLAE